MFPLVTTANNAAAQIRLSNPGPTPANVTLAVTLAPYHVPNQTLTVPPYGSAVATITPNPAIPAASYASVALRSSAPVIVALATGTGTHVALSAPPSPEPEYLVGDFTGRGYNAVALTNTSSKSITFTITTLPKSGGTPAGDAQTGMTAIRLNANTTDELKTLIPALANLHGVTFIIKASRPSLEVTLTLPSSPVGTTVVSALDGR
jgi:hypothetical protein